VAEGWTNCHEYPQLQYAANNLLRTMPAVSTHASCFNPHPEVGKPVYNLN